MPDTHAKVLEKKEYGSDLVNFEDMKNLTALVITVAHENFNALTPEALKQTLNGEKLIVDVKGKLDVNLFEGIGVSV